MIVSRKIILFKERLILLRFPVIVEISFYKCCGAGTVAAREKLFVGAVAVMKYRLRLPAPALGRTRELFKT
jgi:hypothetical protein